MLLVTRMQRHPLCSAPGRCRETCLQHRARPSCLPLLLPAQPRPSEPTASALLQGGGLATHPLRHLTALTRLSLQHCKLPDFPTELSYLVALQGLDLSSNNFMVGAPLVLTRAYSRAPLLGSHAAGPAWSTMPSHSACHFSYLPTVVPCRLAQRTRLPLLCFRERGWQRTSCATSLASVGCLFATAA